MSDPAASDSFEQAKACFLRGLECQKAGQDAQAERHYFASLRLLPGRASTLVNLAAVTLALARPADALAHAEQALAAEPGSADALLHRATALAELGRPHDALAAFDDLLAAAPAHPIAWSSRGGLLRELGRHAEAAQAYREALRHGADAEVNRYFLAAVEGDAAPSTAPRDYVRRLFDAYAADFDHHLTGALRYQAHRRLVEGLAASGAGAFDAALDLGCGTGLCGPLVRPRVQRLHGVDLSPRMLEQARSLGVYDRLECADAAEFLAGTRERFDLVLAADVFIYIGALEAVFAGVRRVMRSGVFAFSVEALPDDEGELRLLPSLRYAHAKAYVARLAAAHGLAVRAIRDAPVREEQGRAIAGAYVYLAC